MPEDGVVGHVAATHVDEEAFGGGAGHAELEQVARRRPALADDEHGAGVVGHVGRWRVGVDAVRRLRPGRVHLVHDHRVAGQRAFVAREAAVLLKESELETQFEETLSTLLASEEKRKTLGENIQALALPNATKHIVNELETILKNRYSKPA